MLPFSGWAYTDQVYNNGLQLIDFTASSITTGGAAGTPAAVVERGIFVNNRLVSLSDLSLAVVDYTNHAAPTIVTELTLARNVITAQPQGSNIAEISSDWWNNDVTWSEVRLLPIANAEETTDSAAAQTVRVDGVNAQVFMNGTFAYVVTNVQVQAPCDPYGRPLQPGYSGDHHAVQRTRRAGPGRGPLERRRPPRQKCSFPSTPWGWWGWGWAGCYWYDWWGGAEVVQVGGNALAFRRWEPIYDPNTQGYKLDVNSSLWVVDLSKPDAPSTASVATSPTMRPRGGEPAGRRRQPVRRPLRVGRPFDRRRQPGVDGSVLCRPRRPDRSRSAPARSARRSTSRVLLVGGSDSDPSLLYTIDYRWDSNATKDDFDVVRVQGTQATLLSTTTLDGYVGTTFVRGSTAYLSAQQYVPADGSSTAVVELHAIDLSDPTAPVDRASQSANGWGWLLDIEGDRAVVISGWGQDGVDIYQLADGQAPQFRQFTRTLGWWPNGVSRQGSSLYLASGYWGVQKVDLQ